VAANHSAGLLGSRIIVVSLMIIGAMNDKSSSNVGDI